MIVLRDKKAKDIRQKLKRLILAEFFTAKLHRIIEFQLTKKIIFRALYGANNISW